MAKQIHDNVFIGEDGIALVQRILYKMGYAWQATGKFDAGIDGHIELRDARNRSMLGAHLAAQVKARREFTAETDTSFEFLCEQERIDYWMRSNIPVLLICVHPDTDEAWFVCVTEYFLNIDSGGAPSFLRQANDEVRCEHRPHKREYIVNMGLAIPRGRHGHPGRADRGAGVVGHRACRARDAPQALATTARSRAGTRDLAVAGTRAAGEDVATLTRWTTERR